MIVLRVLGLILALAAIAGLLLVMHLAGAA